MSRVLTLHELTLAVAEWRREGATVVLASGCFDPIHQGHIQHLVEARALGNVLVVGVASDRIIREYKKRRPFQTDAARAAIMSSLRCVDAVAVNDACCELIEAVKPHVYAKGTEYRNNLTPDLEAEAELLRQYGGRLEFVSGPTICSSTALLAAV